MTYWLMQLHPEEPHLAVQRTIESLVAGYIGLDFASDVGDLTRTEKPALPANQRNYWAFAHEMREGDKVLIIAHQVPFALVTVAGEYNYIRSEPEKIGVWFRHFRKVNDVRYYADHVLNPHHWERITLVGTILPLRDRSTTAYQLIQAWSESAVGASAG